MQQGPELRIDTEKKASESETGFPLVRFETVLPAVQLVVAGESRRIPVGYRVSSSPLPETKSFSLIMESSETALEKITKPVWATGIGREGADLYVTLSDQRTLHWFNPGRVITSYSIHYTKLYEEANLNAGVAAAKQIVRFLENGDTTFKVN